MSMMKERRMATSPAVQHLDTVYENKNEEASTLHGEREPNPFHNTPLLEDTSSAKTNSSSLFADETKSVETETTDVDTIDDLQSETLDPVKKKNQIQSALTLTAKGFKKTASVVQKGAMDTVTGVKGISTMSVQAATSLLWGADDGQVRDGGFVTFSSLAAKAQCVQMIHHQEPFCFQVSDAPLPDEIFWNNVGLSHKAQQIGFITAQVLTATLCVFWTIPVTFITSLAEVDSLKHAIPSLETAIENYPWIEPLLSQLNPILLVILKVLIPIILAKFSAREGHVSQNALNASVLTKNAVFLVSGKVFKNSQLLAMQIEIDLLNQPSLYKDHSNFLCPSDIWFSL